MTLENELLEAEASVFLEGRLAKNRAVLIRVSKKLVDIKKKLRKINEHAPRWCAKVLSFYFLKRKAFLEKDVIPVRAKIKSGNKAIIAMSRGNFLPAVELLDEAVFMAHSGNILNIYSDGTQIFPSLSYMNPWQGYIESLRNRLREQFIA